MKPLSTYLSEERIGLSEFGRRIDESPQNVHRYCQPPAHPASRIPKRQTMVKIFVETAGVVEPNDFYGLPALDHASAGAVSSEQAVDQVTE